MIRTAPLAHLNALRGASLFLLLSACGGGGLVNQQDDKDDTDEPATGTPNMVLETTSVDFGEVALDGMGTSSVNIQNTGSATLTLINVTVSDAVFTSTASSGLQVPAGSTTSLGLRYLPTSYGSHTATVTLETDDPDTPDATITLSGSVVTDADDDGYDSEDAGGEDCDDGDARINPDADDEWYDGIDTNCDGADDYDQDGDGYQTDVHNEDPTDGGGDCQDSNDAIHPGAADAWYDGIDRDCDGSDDWDKDGDGYGNQALGHGDDCDDEDIEVNPDADEIFNNKDDDCSGEADGEIPGHSSDLVYYGYAAGDKSGSSLTMGDLDNDGYAEIIVGSEGFSGGRGAVSIFSGASLPSSGGDMYDAENTFRGDGSADYLGSSVAFLASAGADHSPHLAVGAKGTSGSYGKVYLISGADLMAGGDADDATVTVSGSGEYHVGRGLSQGLDMDADGLEELYGYYSTSTSTAPASLWLLYGDSVGSYTMATVDATFTTSDGENEIMYDAFPNGGDLDGDGYDDAIYCDHLTDVSEANDGAVWALFGSPAQYSATEGDIGSLGTVAVRGSKYERLGWLCAMGPDWDGDGDNELWAVNLGTSNLYMIEGTPDMKSGTMVDSEEAVLSYSFGGSDPDPIELRSIGDWDGDGKEEMALGLDETSSKAGRVWIFSSQVTSGEYDADQDALAVLEGDNEDPYYQANFGAAISALPGDVNGDGTHDLVIGDWGYGSSASMGAVYISFNLLE